MTPPMAPRSHGGCRIEFDGRQVGTNGCVITSMPGKCSGYKGLHPFLGTTALST
ncbi:unnamed protein product, partial [Ectocarpus sp. 12 AP-2014]